MRQLIEMAEYHNINNINNINFNIGDYAKISFIEHDIYQNTLKESVWMEIIEIVSCNFIRGILRNQPIYFCHEYGSTFLFGINQIKEIKKEIDMDYAYDEYNNCSIMYDQI